MPEYTSPLFNTDNQYLKYYIYVWEDSTNVINNTSLMSVSVIALRTNTGYTTNYSGGCAIKLDGVEQPSQYWNWGEKPVSYESYTELYSTGDWNQAHDSNGAKTMNIAASCWWYSNGSVYIDSAWQSFNVTLTAIDRAAPTVTISTSNVGVNSFSLSATASTTCDIWQRSIDNGSTWTQFSTTAGTSASTTITGLSPNTTYNVKVRARRQYNQVYGTSGTSSVKTIGNSVLNSVTTVTADDATVSFTINTTVYVPSYTHKLEIKNGNTTILTKTGLTLSSGNNTITLTSSERTTLLNAMANIKNFTGTFNLSTWSGSTQIGSASSKTATVQTTAANSAPTFTGFTYVDGNSTSVAVTENNQVLIQGISTITVTANTATAKNSATIKSYSLVFGSTTASSTTTTITTGAITNTGTVALTVSAVDSRGYSTSQTVNVTSIPYTKIVFNTNSIRRVNEVENTIQLAFTGTIQSIPVEDTDKNSVQLCQYRYKKTSDQDYGAYTNITSSVTRSGNNLSYSNDSLVALDANYSWNIQVNIQDKLTSDTITLTVGQGTPLMSWRTKKVGVNQKNPTEALDVVGNIKVSGTSAFSGAVYHSGDSIFYGKDVILGTSGSNSDDSGDLWWRYGNGREKMRIWSDTAPTSKAGPQFRLYKSDGTSLYSGRLPLADGTSASGTWGIDISGSAAKLNGYASDTNNTANAVVRRDGNGDIRVRYAYTTHVNQSSSDQTTTYDSTSGFNIYCNSDGWLRKAKAVTQLYSGSLAPSGQCSWANYKSYSKYIVFVSVDGTANLCTGIIPRNLLTSSRSANSSYVISNEVNWSIVYIYYSGTTGYAYLEAGASNARLKYIFGLN